MSTLSQFAPFAGGGLKSFQTGYVQSGALSGTFSIGEDYLFTDVTVSSVNTAKTMSSFYGSQNNNLNSYSMYSYSDVGSGGAAVVTVRLTSSTNLRLASAQQNNSFARLNGRWQIAEAN